MADKTIPQLTERTTLDNNDLFVIEQSSAGTGSTKLGTVKDKMLGTSTINTLGATTVTGAISILNDLHRTSASAHNTIYRGKNLGTSVTSAQWNSIKNGDFDDLYIGDYWVLNNRNYRIAAFDYYCGKRVSATVHHVVITVDSIMGGTQAIASSNANGYYGSTIHTTTLASGSTIRTTIESAFGASHILSHDVNLSSTVADGVVTALTSTSTDILIPTAGNVIGRSVQTINTSDSTPYLGDLDEDQFPLFMYNKSLQTGTGNNAYWLRDPVGTKFAAMFTTGLVRALTPSSTGYAGVRPVFCIYQAS